MFYFGCVFKQKTAYEMRIRDWSSDVCSSDLSHPFGMCKRFHERHLKLPEKSSACADFLDSSINFLAKTHVKWGSFDRRDIAVGHGRAHQREQISKLGGQVCGKCRIGCESQDGEDRTSTRLNSSH